MADVTIRELHCMERIERHLDDISDSLKDISKSLQIMSGRKDIVSKTESDLQLAIEAVKNYSEKQKEDDTHEGEH